MKNIKSREDANLRQWPPCTGLEILLESDGLFDLISAAKCQDDTLSIGYLAEGCASIKLQYFSEKKKERERKMWSYFLTGNRLN